MAHDASIPRGDRDAEEPAELGGSYFRRLLIERHGIDPLEPTSKARRKNERLSPTERIDAIFRGEDPDSPEPGGEG